MGNLSHREMEALLSSLALLYSDIEPETLPERAFAVVNNLIANEAAAFDFFNSKVEHSGKT